MRKLYSKEDMPGRLIELGRDSGVWAFSPSPLPPKMSLDTKLLNALGEASGVLGELRGVGRNIANPDILIGPFTRREAVLSSRMEGTQANVEDVYAFEAGQLSLTGNGGSQREADAQEVYNYVRALNYGLKRVEELPISLRLTRELHEILMEGVRGQDFTPGQFRKSQNWIGPPDCEIEEARFVPPPVNEMIKALNSLELYLHDSNNYPPLVRLALVHYQFEAIHPFLDGNGRVGRLLISLLLEQWGLLPLPLLYLSDFFERHKQDYIDLMFAASTHGQWSEWVNFFLKGVKEQSQAAIEKAKQLQDLQSNWRGLLQEKRVPGWMIGLIDKLFEMPFVDVEDVQDWFQVSAPTARQALIRLEELGILTEITGRQRKKLYVAIGVYDAVN